MDLGRRSKIRLQLLLILGKPVPVRACYFIGIDVHSCTAVHLEWRPRLRRLRKLLSLSSVSAALLAIVLLRRFLTRQVFTHISHNGKTGGEAELSDPPVNSYK